MRHELPQGWTKATLSDVASVEWGNTSMTKRSFVEKGFPAYSAGGQSGFVFQAEHHGPGFVLGAIGTVGKCYWADGDWTAIKNTIVIKPDPRAVLPRFAFHYLNAPERWPQSGSSQQFIALGSARQVEIPLAPLAEQQRIVAKLETPLGKVDVCQQRLAKIPLLLKRFRQSILAAACSGRLTADWREEHDVDDEWSLERLSELFTMQNGKSLIATKRRDGDIPVYGGNGFMGNHNVANADGQVIVIGRVGAQCGNVHFVTGKVWVTDNAISLEAKRDVEPAFYALFLRSQNLNQLSAGTGQPYVSQGILSQIETPVVSIAEQQEIVRRVESLFAVADQLEARYAKAKAHIDKLTQSILAKAFRGELVPQDLNDEPASVLLEQIRNAKRGGDRKQSAQLRRSAANQAA